MATSEYPHVVKPEGAPAHLAAWPRVRVAQIVADHIGNGWSAEEILRQHPHLGPAEVHAALAYYFDHAAEIDAEIDAELGAIERASSGPASPLRVRLLAARRGHAA